MIQLLKVRVPGTWHLAQRHCDHISTIANRDCLQGTGTRYQYLVPAQYQVRGTRYWVMYHADLPLFDEVYARSQWSVEF